MIRPLLLLLAFGLPVTVRSQHNLLLNGGFEEVNTCTEYSSECGVEAWFYLKEVKAQMLNHEGGDSLLGFNSFQIYYNWKNDPGFTPVIGTLLPCRMQAGHRYLFRGLISATLNPKLILKPAVSFANRFYVPGRPFSRSFRAEVITELTPVPHTAFYQFEYSYTATGNEDYLTFGTFVAEDSVAGKRQLTGVQTIAMTLDRFELIATDGTEGPCESFSEMKDAIYAFDYRHKQMDYPLYATGQIKIQLPVDSLRRITRNIEPGPVMQWKTETLTLDNISFAFDKANLRDSTVARLQNYFSGLAKMPDSIAIEGHTDSVGNDEYNLKLSRVRCISVRDWLASNKIVEATKISTHSFGSAKPVASNNSAEGRARNRRVELVLYWKP